MIRKASCCCGQSSIEVDGDPDIQGICHCGNCKQRTGSAFGWSAYFDDAKIQQTLGHQNTYLISGPNPQTRHFCTNCGTTLFWKSASFEGMTGIAGGCFLEAPLPAPELTLSNEGQCTWLSLPAHWEKHL